MAAVYNCKDVACPKTTPINNKRFGLPIQGVIGRNGNVPIAIVIHCIDKVLEDPCNMKTPKLNSEFQSGTTSYHYVIRETGEVRCEVDPLNIAWGFGPKVEDCTTNVITYDCQPLRWALAAANPGVPADYYTIHIAMESTKDPEGRRFKKKKQTDIQVGTGIANECECTETQPLLDQFSGAELRPLVHLIAWLVKQFPTVLLADTNINWMHNIDCCQREECGCAPCIKELICAVNNYCQIPEQFGDASFGNGLLTHLYGEDLHREKMGEEAGSFLARHLRFNSATSKTEIKINGVWTPLTIV